MRLTASIGIAVGERATVGELSEMRTSPSIRAKEEGKDRYVVFAQNAHLAAGPPDARA